MGKRTVYTCDFCGDQFEENGPLEKIWILVYQSGDGEEIAFMRGYTRAAEESLEVVDGEPVPGFPRPTVHYTCGPACATSYFDDWVEKSLPSEVSTG